MRQWVNTLGSKWLDESGEMLSDDKRSEAVSSFHYETGEIEIPRPGYEIQIRG